jgi:hypothetical protein
MQLPDESPSARGKILDHDAGMGGPDADMIDQRARELAAIAGLDTDRSIDDFRQDAIEELTGQANLNVPNDDAGPVGDLVGEGGDGYDEVSSVPAGASNNDEQTIGEQLFTEGVDEADHDRMIASREEELRDEP